ncbi:T9SS type A sorting domain-containing protein [Solirubrum puertoriconensis]|uniref:Fibronectin type-III domain-containing protein n=1 Tax=Solirubrum puertoriconensis TaxID=1751427 RepID=A0A9X0HN76_SOLP1|nr:T9SS type A sorting domain-containing protein [Solirubrum puertoriconensis]KUG09091.1 hypothetical protein ASU33_19930 [Solirubrum puertoriconensis]
MITNQSSPRAGYLLALKLTLSLLVCLVCISLVRAQTPNFPEGFEAGSKTGYAAGNVTLGSGSWNLNDALIGTSTSDAKVGTKSVRIRNTGILAMNFDVSTGASTVSVSHAVYTSYSSTNVATLDAPSSWELVMSTDNGASFTRVGSSITTSLGTLETATFTVNQSGNVRFQVRKLSGGTARLNIDQFDIKPFGASSFTTGAVAGSPLCLSPGTGATISVPYSAPAELSNSFAVQLSDGQGGFPSDLSLNLIGAGSASPLAAVIPAETPAGSNYRVRVVHPGSATAATQSSSLLVLNTPPATNSVSLNSTAEQTLTTTGTGVALTATAGAASSFAWYFGPSENGLFSSAVSGANSAAYTPRGTDFPGAGTYYLVARATSSCGSVIGTSSPVKVTITAPVATLDITPLTVPDFGRVFIGSASASSPVSVTGSNLTSEITITPAPGFEIRTGTNAFACCAIVLAPNGGAVNSTIDVRFVPTMVQGYSAQLTINTADKPAQPPVNVSGSGAAPVYPAAVSSAPVSNITPNGATTGGTVLEDGNTLVTARGVVYSLTPAPTINDDFTQDGSGLGAFASTLSGLLPNTRYYVRAYATNEVGTVYGEEHSFTSLPAALAAEPTESAILTATTVNPTTVTLSISGGTGAKKLLTVTQGPAETGAPVDAITYSANLRFGQGDQIPTGNYVVLAGSASTLTVTGLLPETEYTFAVYDYNDDNTTGAENYRQAAPGTLTLSTPPQPTQLLLAEDFDYPAGELLTAHGWTAHSGGTTAAIQVSSQGLSYGGYGPRAGRGAALTANGQDVHRTFAPQPPGTAMYASLLVNVSSATAGGDYFFHLAPDPLDNTFRARLFVRAAATAGKVQFGVSGSTSTASAWTSTEYDANTTYLLVLKYVFGPSGTETRLYVNPGLVEPATADLSKVEDASSAPASIGAVALRQGSAQVLTADGIRVASAYALARPTGSPLPVVLTRFEAALGGGNRAVLGWITAQERNSQSFAVERSTDGRSFTEAGRVAAAGQSTILRHYEWVDPQPLAGLTYYRLRQLDQDGKAELSPVRTVSPLGVVTRTLRVFPNPTNGAQATLQLRGYQGQSLTVQVRNVLGQVVWTRSLTPATAEAELPLPLPTALPAGAYGVSVQAGGQTQHTRLLLTR